MEEQAKMLGPELQWGTGLDNQECPTPVTQGLSGCLRLKMNHHNRDASFSPSKPLQSSQAWGNKEYK